MEHKDLTVDGKRLQSTLEEMAKIGATPGSGVQRLTLTDEDKQARDLFVKWLKEINLEITIDEMGNIFGRRSGKNDDLPPVMSGSHIDSQPKGGRFDGTLGVMGVLEVLRTLYENNIETERPLVIVDWTNEEGSRFAPAMLASGVWSEALDRDWDDDHALTAWDLVRKDFEKIAARRGCLIKIEETWRVEHSPFDERMVQWVLDIADELGYPSLYMVSGAGHDASYMNQVCPTAMIFVPSIGGRSHVEVENTKWEDCEAGANVLLHAILQSANEK